MELLRPGAPNRNHAPATKHRSRPPRDWTGNSTAAPGPAPGPRPFWGVPPVGGASLTTPPLGSLPERGRGRPATTKLRLLAHAGPRRPERPGRPALFPQAPARPLYGPKPLPRQRGLRGPLLLILGLCHRPSAAETGTSSAPSRCLHKGSAAFSALPAGRWSTATGRTESTPGVPRAGGGGRGGRGGACLRGRDVRARSRRRPMGGRPSLPPPHSVRRGCWGLWFGLWPTGSSSFSVFGVERGVHFLGGLAFSSFAPRQSAHMAPACVA